MKLGIRLGNILIYHGATCFKGVSSFDMNEIKNPFGNILICSLDDKFDIVKNVEV